MLLRACGASDLLVDTGLNHPGMCDLAELADVAGARVHEVVRLETVVESLAADGVHAADFGTAVADALAGHASRAVALQDRRRVPRRP